MTETLTQTPNPTQTQGKPVFSLPNPDDLLITPCDIAQLIPDPGNVRLHDARNHESIKRSIQRFGSGTTLIACEQTGRVCFGMEIEPCYVDVACRRYYEYAHEIPRLEATGEPFPVDAEDLGETNEM